MVFSPIAMRWFLGAPKISWYCEAKPFDFGHWQIIPKWYAIVTDRFFFCLLNVFDNTYNAKEPQSETCKLSGGISRGERLALKCYSFVVIFLFYFWFCCSSRFERCHCDSSTFDQKVDALPVSPHTQKHTNSSSIKKIIIIQSTERDKAHVRHKIWHVAPDYRVQPFCFM